MHDTPELPPRPAPPRRPAHVASAWLTWFGVGRLAVVACCVVIVAGGGYWLVRSPTPSTEAGLPFAQPGDPASSGGTNSPGATLPAPSVPDDTGDTASEASPDPPTSIVVHVAGAVTGPGVYRLSGDPRVHTAIEAAGGATADADLDGLNLAAPVGDGQRIYVPVAGEVDPADVPSDAIAPIDVGGGAPGAAIAAGPIDLNVASAAELEQLPGVGPATAGAIVDDRDRNGPFASVDDLDRVPGIGPAKLDAIRDLVTA